MGKKKGRILWFSNSAVQTISFTWTIADAYFTEMTEISTITYFSNMYLEIRVEFSKILIFVYFKITFLNDQKNFARL